MSKRCDMGLAWLAALAAVTDVALSFVADSTPLRAVTKPLPALILALMAYRRGGTAPRRLAYGLILAAAGDELLLVDTSVRFLAGMLCFAAMHGCYIASYIAMTAARIKPRPLVNALLTIAVVFIVLTLAPHAGTFAWPLIAYSILLATMVLFAVDLVGNVEPRTAALVASGALIFMFSDALLAFVKFYPGFPLRGAIAECTIVGTYFLAQILIATGVIRSESRAGSTTRS
jgi:uncharacterized membrane protein YhhN